MRAGRLLALRCQSAHSECSQPQSWAQHTGAVHCAALMIECMAAQASTLEKLQKGDVSGFVEEVRPYLAYISPTPLACLHACRLKVSPAY